MTDLARDAGIVLAAVALLLGALSFASTRDPILATSVVLDLLLAAGLLRLSADTAWQAIATAGGIVAIRKVIGFGLETSDAAARPQAPSRHPPPTGRD